MSNQDEHNCWPLNGDVLIVDDDESYSHIIAYRLVAAGCTCHTVHNHAKAFQCIAENNSIEVIILDYTIHGIRPGLFLKRLKAAHPDIRIVGHSVFKRRKTFQDLGVDLYLPKPLEVDDLVRLLTKPVANLAGDTPK